MAAKLLEPIPPGEILYEEQGRSSLLDGLGRHLQDLA
jgi:hypothetical protein